jgi:carboxyl-terminal processing protease
MSPEPVNPDATPRSAAPELADARLDHSSTTDLAEDGTAGPSTVPGYGVRVGPVLSSPPGHRGPAFAIAIAIVAVLAGGALFMAGFSLGIHRDSQPGTASADDQLFKPFWDAYHAIVDRYAGGEIDKEAIRNGAIKGMFEAIGDPYSSYLTPDQFQESLQGISGQFEGIGAEIGTQKADGTTSDCTTLGTDCRLVVVAPIEGSPAQKAGIKAGDIVLAVDGSTLDGLTVDDARDRIRGKKGTSVKLTIARDNGTPFDLTITRDVIVQQEVITRTLADGKVGYVRLTGFSDSAATAFHKAIADDVAAGRTKLIIDLREDPGGFVTAARAVASEFIGSGTIFWQEDAQGTKTATTAQEGGAATDPKIKVVVLIDKGSASASEIVAGALQDTGRATIVGETSFGKGTVQEWTTLEGAGGYRLTIAKWLTPDGRWIHHVGITPDVPVTVPANTPTGKDPILDRGLEILTGSTALPWAA